MPLIRNLAHLPSPNGSGTILWRLPQLWLMGKASPGQLRKVSCFDLDPLFSKVDLQALMKAGKWMSRKTFTSFYSQDLSNQVDVLHKVDIWWLIEDHGGHIYLALDSLCFLFLFHPLFLSEHHCLPLLMGGRGGIRTLPSLQTLASLLFSVLVLCPRVQD